MRHIVKLNGGRGDEAAVFTQTGVGDDCALTCELNGRRLTATGPDYFEALCSLRLELEKDGLIPVCYGASLKAFPSGMARDMGEGLKVYRLSLGKQSAMSDLVGIFENGNDVVPATVAEQQEFYRRWCQSLNRDDADPPANADALLPEYLSIGESGPYEVTVSFEKESVLSGKPGPFVRRRMVDLHTFLIALNDIVEQHSGRLTFDEHPSQLEEFRVDLVARKIRLKARRCKADRFTA
ncbi:hypothetical protein CURE108131_19150 [Cupriavidus respiraculi]|uniref:Uncharacterized protein n=1 Tax=Cupriavidus respiraculi TaxID=195930 RepID=A0ABM8XU35_9BURK|nr:hypothetical protein [Cupriavidus respiraculi]MBY4949508.1 hypothetical protein [Cupriavidus respiraculi]CAG9183874.1 hypothetical protein LMG21510_04966 [Cupriavidus respiraculi]